MSENLNVGYGGQKKVPMIAGKVFMVATSSQAGYDLLTQIFKGDSEGKDRIFTTFALALAACTADRGDSIYVHPGFATAMSAAELLLAETKGVTIIQAGLGEDGLYTAYAADTAIAGASDKSLFTVTGLVELVQIVGKVGTVIETQDNNTLLKINPTAGADVDLCAALNISADAASSFMTITGTVGDAMVNTPSGAMQAQATSIIVDAGVIELETAADNTGTIKWFVKYRPLEAGARIFAA